MTRWRSAALFCLALAACGAGAARPPAELSGLWSAGPSACEAGVGVRFGANAIVAVYDRQRETLFARPRYGARSVSGRFQVRIAYDLPHRPGGARVPGAYGVLVLGQDEKGGLSPLSHQLVDARTGTVRLAIGEDPATAAMTLTPCGPHPWREGLRGRS